MHRRAGRRDGTKKVLVESMCDRQRSGTGRIFRCTHRGASSHGRVAQQITLQMNHSFLVNSIMSTIVVRLTSILSNSGKGHMVMARPALIQRENHKSFL